LPSQGFFVEKPTKTPPFHFEVEEFFDETSLEDRELLHIYYRRRYLV
jgi:hypothetical protein